MNGVTIAGRLLALVMVFGVPDLAAQAESPDLSGNWSGAGQGMYPCGGLIDQNGQPRLDCQFPIEKMKLNARTKAWHNFFDEAMSPKFYCQADSLPVLSGHPFQIIQLTDRIMIHYVHLYFEVVRTIWMDGRAHPPPSEAFHIGHSTGHYEGNELVVETTNFTFDPNGIDPHANIPSSALKRIVERFSRVAPDRMRYVFTVEDPLFLKEPFTHTIEYRPATRRPEKPECDVELSSLPLKFIVPKYPD